MSNGRTNSKCRDGSLHGLDALMTAGPSRSSPCLIEILTGNDPEGRGATVASRKRCKLVGNGGVDPRVMAGLASNHAPKADDRVETTGLQRHGGQPREFEGSWTVEDLQMPRIATGLDKGGSSPDFQRTGDFNVVPTHQNGHSESGGVGGDGVGCGHQ